MAKAGNPRMERGRGGREGGDREGERERQAGSKEGLERSLVTSQLHISCEHMITILITTMV